MAVLCIGYRSPWRGKGANRQRHVDLRPNKWRGLDLWGPLVPVQNNKVMRDTTAEADSEALEREAVLVRENQRLMREQQQLMQGNQQLMQKYQELMEKERQLELKKQRFIESVKMFSEWLDRVEE